MRYPAGWWTNDGSVTELCRYFHPEPVRVEPGTELIGVAIRIDIEDLSYERAIAGGGMDVTDERRLEIDGQQAMRREGKVTRSVYLRTGARIVSYYVMLSGGRTLFATTAEVQGVDFERSREVLDAMMSTLDVTP